MSVILLDKNLVAQGGYDPSATVYGRLSAPEAVALGKAAPLIGVYSTGAQTNPWNQGKRDSLVTLVFDYYAQGPDPDKLSRQAELAAEAIMKTIDRLPTANPNAGTILAGDGRFAVAVNLDLRPPLGGHDNYEAEITLTCVVRERDHDEEL